MADWKNIGNRARDLTLTGLGKARDLGESARLNLDNVSEEEERKKLLAEIGRRFMEANPVPPEEYKDLYQKMDEVNARIQANKERLSHLKG